MVLDPFKLVVPTRLSPLRDCNYIRTLTTLLSAGTQFMPSKFCQMNRWMKEQRYFYFAYAFLTWLLKNRRVLQSVRCLINNKNRENSQQDNSHLLM